VLQYLRVSGVEHALVEVGGELRGHGMKPDGQPWWVMLENPPGSGDAAQPLPETVVALHGLSVATSGDYRRFFMVPATDAGAARYSHTIDPRSGEPISHGLAGVTVLHPECMAADAISTALNVLGAAEGLRFAAARGIAARFVQRAGDGFVETLSPAFMELCR
jgi:FAD:protein FMN transferase